MDTSFTETFTEVFGCSSPPPPSTSITTSIPGVVESSCSGCSEVSELSFSVQQIHSSPPPAPPAPPASSSSVEKVVVIPPPRPIAKSGEASPTQVQPRKLSTAIATAANSNHPVLAGRPTVVVPYLSDLHNSNSNHSDSNSSTPIHHNTKKNNKNSNSNMASPPPKSMIRRTPPRSAPPKILPSRHHSMNLEPTRSVAPAPIVEQEQQETTTTTTTSFGISRPKPKLHRAHSVPIPNAGHRLDHQFRIDPHPLRLDAWSEPAAETFSIRGPAYLKDKKKMASEPSAFSLLTVDLIQSNVPLHGGMCAHPLERVQQALKREAKTGIRELPAFVFAVNLCVPGCAGVFYHAVSYFGINQATMADIYSQSSPFGRLMHKFLFGDDDAFRNQTFKLIPRIVQGNFVVKKAVGSKPSILGKKIKQYYIRGGSGFSASGESDLNQSNQNQQPLRYFEVLVDIASDAVAQRIVKLALGYCKTMVVDMMYLLEGTEEATLPERILGGVRMKNIDFKEKDGKRTVPAMDYY
jgi:hypothetical protein